MKKKSIIFLIILFSVTSLYTQSLSPKRELRGAWIATVGNIDWPKNRYNPTSGEQISDLVNILKKLKEAGINTVFFQVRTECDALYKSELEPWSYWLTSEQGNPPEPYYDPLEFAIAEAHKLGMELHAWLNPYRAQKKVGEYTLAENHIVNQKPEWILSFKDYKMLNPGIPEVKTHILNVVKDIVKRYDIDGIHFDDYFYPYSPKVSTEDEETFSQFGGNFSDIDDWRRDNINSLMAMINDFMKKEKPYLKFGISPFGIVENKYAQTDGLNSYSVLYCDPLTWIKEKIVDYVNPQLYWEMDHPKAAYSKLLPWWNSIAKDIHLYIGLFSSRFMGRRYDGKSTELSDQLRLNREMDNVHGVVYFSSSSITNENAPLFDTLKNNFYKYPALVPLMNWKDTVPPLSPEKIDMKKDSVSITLTWEKPGNAADGEVPKRFVIYKFKENEEINLNDPSKIIHITERTRVRFEHDFNNNLDDIVFVVTSLDRLQNESGGVQCKLKANKQEN